MNTHIEIDLEGNSLMITEKGCSGYYYDMDEHTGQTLVENICDSLRDYLLYECKEEKEMNTNAFPAMNDCINNYNLQDFDPKIYKNPNMISLKFDRSRELGYCSNLITDMIRNGATEDELSNVIKYSMVIIDAEKELLDWKKAAEDFRIRRMHTKYSNDRWEGWKNWQKDVANKLEYRTYKTEERAELRAKIMNLRNKGLLYSEIAKKLDITESFIRFLMTDIEPGYNPKHDPVNHPSHYTDGKIEVIDFIEDKKLGFHLGNAVKYISRAGKKDPSKEIEDLEKAQWYLNRRIQHLKDCRKHESDVCGYPPKNGHDMPGDPDGD